MRNGISNHIRSNIVGYVALFVALSASAYALPGTNTVDTLDIVNGQVKNPDILNGAVTTNKLRDGGVGNADLGPDSVTGAKVLDDTLRGADVENDSLTGADVVEASLGEVPSATLGGLGRDTGTVGCNPESDAYMTCIATSTVNISAPTRVLIIGQIRALPETFGSGGFGGCRVGSNTGALVESEAAVFVKDQDDSMAMSGVTGVLGPGPIAFGLDCHEVAGGITYDHAHLSFVELSAG